MASPVRVADSETRLRSFGHVALVVVGAFAAGLVLAIAAAQVLVTLGFSPDADVVTFLVVSTVFQFVGFYLAVYWYLDRLGSVEALVHAGRPGLRAIAWGVGGLLALLVANVVLSVVLTNFGLEGAQNLIVQRGREHPLLFLYLIPVTVLFVAPAEELVFRGVVQGLFRQAYGVVPAVVLASAVFGLAHFLALGGTGSRGATIAVIVVLGLILGAVYELAGSIYVSTAVHAGWNVTVFAWEYAATTGLV